MNNQHPILFSTPMVKAIMEGRKTQTRRIAKNIKINEFGNVDFSFTRRAGINTDATTLNDAFLGVLDYCPYGVVGDVLWVRETWNHCIRLNSQTYEKVGSQYTYKADLHQIIKGHDRFKPSIFMPKAACRLFLRITDVKVERLQDITEEDAKSEGVETKKAVAVNFEQGTSHIITNYKENFRLLWHKINGEESWNSNPFVWVVSFERIEKPQ